MSLTRRHFLHGTVAAGLGTLLADRAAAADSPFLQGNFAPVREEVTATDLPIVGKLPPELDGLFVRNGPNPQFAPPGRYHWFDGDGMLHGVRLQGGKASYRNRYIRTSSYLEENKAGKPLSGGLLDPPDPKRLLSGKPFKNTANTALVYHHGKLLALWEAGEPHIIDVPDLTTRGTETFGGKLRHPFTAHPKVDPVSGELIFFGYTPIAPTVFYGVADAKGALVHATTVKVPRPVMMHDFAVSANHSVFMDLPVLFDIASVSKGGDAFKYAAEHGARFGILPRRGKGDAIRWFDVQPCYVFHTLNAYDEGDAVVVLGCRMARFPDLLGGAPKLGDKELRAQTGVLYRWKCDLKTGKVEEGPLDDVPSDFPRVNETLAGRPTRFGYAAEAGHDLFRGLLKYDLTTGKCERHGFGAGRSGGEGVFVPRPGATGEDDGWLLSYVHDAERNKGELVIVDAKHFGAEPAARVLLPARVPYGFHAAWVPC